MQFPGYLILFTEEILNGKHHFLCSADVLFRHSKRLILQRFGDDEDFISYGNSLHKLP